MHTEKKRYCEPDTERDGNPCKHCGRPGASTGIYGARECVIARQEERHG